MVYLRIENFHRCFHLQILTYIIDILSFEVVFIQSVPINVVYINCLLSLPCHCPWAGNCIVANC